MPRFSAGLLMFRRTGSGIEVFLVHPGGPFWQKKDAGAWSIPKGELDPNEDPFTAARREFQEETGLEPAGECIPLGEIKQSSGKIVTAWAFEGDCSPEIRSSTFSLEWPPKSGKIEQFPEVDRAAWFPLAEAHKRLLPAQSPFLDRLEKHLSP